MRETDDMQADNAVQLGGGGRLVGSGSRWGK